MTIDNLFIVLFVSLTYLTLTHAAFALPPGMKTVSKSCYGHAVTKTGLELNHSCGHLIMGDWDHFKTITKNTYATINGRCKITVKSESGPDIHMETKHYWAAFKEIEDECDAHPLKALAPYKDYTGVRNMYKATINGITFTLQLDESKPLH